MQTAWSTHDHFLLTEDTALSRSLAAGHRTAVVDHVALGQAKLGNPLKMVASAARNFFQSARIMLRERPDVVISTGAGSVYFGILWARLLGAKVVIIESFARFDQPSAFARIAAPLAHKKVVQSQALLKYWPDADLFDPLRLIDSNFPEKNSLLFVTVGATLSFDRMVENVAELNSRGLIPEHIVIQTGEGGLSPTGLEVYETLPFDAMNTYMRKADIVICHGGTGSLITALRQGCRIIAMPRQFERGEHYDNHQLEITTAFESRGLLTIANSAEEMAMALKDVRRRERVFATTDATELTNHLMDLLMSWS